MRDFRAVMRPQSLGLFRISRPGIRTWVLGILAMAFSLSTPSALHLQGTVVITFEDQTAADGPGTGVRVYVERQYAEQGVLFNRPAVFDYDRGIAVPGFAHSPSRAIAHCAGIEFCTTPFVIQFRRPQRRVKAWVGSSGRLEQNGTAVLEAYTAGGSLIGRSTAVIPASARPRMQAFVEVVSDSLNISVVRISSPDLFIADFAIDDIEFSTAAPPGQPAVDTLTVPGVIGLTTEEARAKLNSRGLVLGGVVPSETPGVTPGLVVGQNPDSGTRASPGSAVTVTVAQAPTQITVRVPDLRGLGVAEAKARLADSWLHLGRVNRVPSRGDSGTVIDQRPDSGAVVDTGTSVAIRLVFTPPKPDRGRTDTGRTGGGGTDRDRIPLWVWLLVAAAVVGAVLRFWRRPDPDGIPQSIGAKLVSDGLATHKVMPEARTDISSEVRFVLASHHTTQVNLGKDPAILEERRLP
jgi:PASTA domain